MKRKELFSMTCSPCNEIDYFDKKGALDPLIVFYAYRIKRSLLFVLVVFLFACLPLLAATQKESVHLVNRGKPSYFLQYCCLFCCSWSKHDPPRERSYGTYDIEEKIDSQESRSLHAANGGFIKRRKKGDIKECLRAKRRYPSKKKEKSHQDQAIRPKKQGIDLFVDYLLPKGKGKVGLHLLGDHLQNKEVPKEITQMVKNGEVYTQTLLAELLESYIAPKEVRQVVISYLPYASFLNIESQNDQKSTPLDYAIERSPFYRLMQEHGAIHSKAKICKEMAATWGASRELNAALALEALKEANTHDIWLLLSLGVDLEEVALQAADPNSQPPLLIPQAVKKMKNPFQVAASMVKANFPYACQRLQAGFNIRGICEGDDCKTGNQFVYHHVGVDFEGPISLADLLDETPCPSCWRYIRVEGEGMNAFRLYRCKYKLKGRPVDSEKYVKVGKGTYIPHLDGQWRYLNIHISPL